MLAFDTPVLSLMRAVITTISSYIKLVEICGTITIIAGPSVSLVIMVTLGLILVFPVVSFAMTLRV